MQEKFVFSTFLFIFAPNALVTGYFIKVNLRKANTEQSLGSFEEYAYLLKETRPIGFNSPPIVFSLTTLPQTC